MNDLEQAKKSQEWFEGYSKINPDAIISESRLKEFKVANKRIPADARNPAVYPANSEFTG
jgi:hypothetical protein